MASIQPARAQCEDSDNAIFRVSVTFYRHCIGPGEVVATIGPADNELGQSYTFPGSTPTRGVDCEVGLFGGGEQLSVKLLNNWHCQATVYAGICDGGGFDATAQIYLRGTPGAAFYVLKSLHGTVTAQHPAGPGETESTGLGAIAVVANGGPPQTLTPSQSSFEAIAGTLTSTPHPTRPGFYLATSVTYSLWGYTFQTIPFCFPACPQVHDYQGRSEIRGFLQAGLGPPPCTGSLAVTVGNCTQSETAPGSGKFFVTRPFDIGAAFMPVGASDCSCCEYRQYIRGSKWQADYSLEQQIYTFLFNHPNNCDNQDAGGPCSVEDTACDRTPLGQASVCRDSCTRYGHREDSTARRTPGNDEYSDAPGGGDRDGCAYGGHDEPSIGKDTDGMPAGTNYEMAHFFEGQIVVKAGPGCNGTGERVLARRRWSACCSGTAGSPPSSACTRGPGRDLIAVGRYVAVGSRTALVRFFEQAGDLTASVVIVAETPETMVAADVGLALDSLTTLRPVGLEKVDSARLGGDIDFMNFPFHAPITGCFPRSVRATLHVLGQQVQFDQDLSAIAPAIPADFDQNGRVEPADISLLVSVWYTSLIQHTLAGDFDNNGAVDPADVSLFVTRWFAAVAGGC